MRPILTCVVHAHDGRLLIAAALVCAFGCYAAFAIGAHAQIATGRERSFWAAISIVSAGCTAWATHLIGLLAFQPGMLAAFEPVLTAVSLLVAIVLIGAGTFLAIKAQRNTRRFASGIIIGAGVGALHYLGQAAYVVVGEVTWDVPMVIVSFPVSLLLFGSATTLAAARSRWIRRCAVPMLLLGIAVLHFSGITAAQITFDPRRALPADAISPEVMAIVVGGVSFGLLVLAVLGFKFTMEAKARFRRDRERLRELANVALEGLLICDGDLIVSANSSFERLSGCDKDKLAGHHASSFLPGLDLPNLPEREERETEMVGAGGQKLVVRVLRQEFTTGHKRQTVFAIRDQRERLRTEAQIRTLAYGDALTGLPNRARFFEILTQHVASRRERDGNFAVLVIGLDRFKPVNDMLGHAAGDMLLRKAADRLSATIRSDDVVARLGGDEFAVLQTDTREPDAAALLAARCVELMSRPFMIEGQLVHIGASVGFAFAPRDGKEPAELLHNADLALFAAKAAGKGIYRAYEPELDVRMRDRRQLEAGLRDALARGELELFYQPLLETRSKRVTSAEALVRWRHPERGLIPPMEFIPLAEETGLIIPLGEWVLATACAEAVRWPSDISVAVNLSPAQFRSPDLAATVSRALAATGLPGRRLELEITEGVLLSDEHQTLQIFNKLRAEGVRISIDDFGTGYSSLSYLRRFPFDKIKVDQSFVRQLPSDPDSAAIVRAIITMGACLGISTTVEGVETAEQLAFTAAEGCDHAQGYLISRPLPAADFSAFLRTGRDLEESNPKVTGAPETVLEGMPNLQSGDGRRSLEMA